MVPEVHKSSKMKGRPHGRIMHRGCGRTSSPLHLSPKSLLWEASDFIFPAFQKTRDIMPEVIPASGCWRLCLSVLKLVAAVTCRKPTELSSINSFICQFSKHLLNTYSCKYINEQNGQNLCPPWGSLCSSWSQAIRPKIIELYFEGRLEIEFDERTWKKEESRFSVRLLAWRESCHLLIWGKP